MHGRPADGETTPSALYMLAEHLDAILAAGEDLLAVARPVPLQPGATRIAADLLLDRLDGERTFVTEIEVLEAALLARVLQARVRAAEVVRLDARFRSIVALFLGSTLPALDAAARLGARGRARHALDFGADPAAYLRDRGVGLGECPTLSFRLSGAIELGPLLDLAATFLSALEIHYDLFEAADTAAAAATETPVFARPVQSDASATRVTTAAADVRVL